MNFRAQIRRGNILSKEVERGYVHILGRFGKKPSKISLSDNVFRLWQLTLRRDGKLDGCCFLNRLGGIPRGDAKSPFES